jgi:hypothetical protein
MLAISMHSLYIYELSVRSSYTKNTEFPATDQDFDTVQWWLNASDCWRIRTFDIDNDIHVHHVPRLMTLDEIDILMKKRYSDVLVGRFDFSSIGITDNGIITNKMKTGSLETAPSGAFAFWNHDNKRYSSQSNPTDG